MALKTPSLRALPDRYPFAEQVPKGGTSCANCYYLGKDEETCRNKFYIANNGDRKLLAKANEFCCMAWSGEKRS